MNAYSEDLRKKIVEAVSERGMGNSEAARTFSVSLSSVQRYVGMASRGESLAPKKRPGLKPKLDEKAIRLLAADLHERPFLTHSQRREYLKAATGVLVSRSTICRAIARIDPQKGGRYATERDEFKRAAWRVMVAEHTDARNLIFVDEMGTHTSLAPVYGYSPCGERVHLEVPRNRGRNTTLLASMSLEGMGKCLAVEGATTAAVFESYVEKVLVPELHPGQIVVMDNLGAHRPKRIRELIEAAGCELLYLPTYSPDYNPIEEAFAKIKNLLRKVAARSKEALIDALGMALSAVSSTDARGFFDHAGYRPASQLL